MHQDHPWLEHQAPSDSADDELLSKTQRKRHIKEITQLGEQLVGLSAKELAKIELNQQLKEHITSAQKITKGGARKRQIQYIGKLLRNLDPLVLNQIGVAYDAIQDHKNHLNLQFKELEHTRERLISEGDEALTQFIEEHPNVERQQLRQLVRAAKAERSQQKSSNVQKKLFQYLRQVISE